MKAVYDIDVLISKFLTGEASPEEAMWLEDWKAERSENQQYFDESAKAMGWVDHIAGVETAWPKVQMQLGNEAPVKQLKPFTLLRMAAALTVLFLIGAIVWMMLPSDSGQSGIYSASQTERKVHLDDGTDITVAQHSSVELAKGYGKNNRKLKLKGSGYFSVKHSDKLPFIIDAGPIHIKDLGTKFDVSATKDTIYVRVDEGVVMIYDNTGLKITLKANESAYYVISSGKLEVEIQVPGITGNSKTYVFDNQPLSQVVERINEVYTEEVVIDNPKAAECRITVQFSDEELELLLDVIAETLGLMIEKQGTIYWIKGTCVH